MPLFTENMSFCFQKQLSTSTFWPFITTIWQHWNWNGEWHSCGTEANSSCCFQKKVFYVWPAPAWKWAWSYYKSKAVLCLACPDGLFLSISWQKAIQVFVSVWILQGLWPLDHQALIRLHWRRSSESKSVTYGSHRQAAPNDPLDV